MRLPSLLARHTAVIPGSIAAAFTALALVAAAPASASRIIECGNYGWIPSKHRTGWTLGRIEGGGTFNVTTRRVSCRKARRFVRRYRGTDSYYPTWNCREVNRYESSDVRCTASGGRVIHWQAGS